MASGNMTKYVDQAYSATGSSTNRKWTTTYLNALIRNGNVVNITQGGVTASPVSITKDDVLCVLPTGFRPSSDVSVLFIYRTVTGGDPYISLATIKSNGEVHSEHGSSAVNMQYFMVIGAFGAL